MIYMCFIPHCFTAGDNVKFGFPMSATVTILAWGLLEFKDAYFASEELGEMYDCIRWPLEWMLKCHTGKNELYVQVKSYITLRYFVSYYRYLPCQLFTIFFKYFFSLSVLFVCSSTHDFSN